MQGSRLLEETAAKSSQEGIGTTKNGRAGCGQQRFRWQHRGSGKTRRFPLDFSASAWQEAPKTEDSLADETKQTNDENDC